MDIKNIFKNVSEGKGLKQFSLFVATVIIILIIFQAGQFVGYRKALYLEKFAGNYDRNFGGPERGMMFDRDKFERPGGHGAVGQIVKINLPNLVISGPDKIEKIISIKDDTSIRKFKNEIKPTDLKINDFIVVIGNPDDQGQIVAKIIRLMPAPPPEINSESSPINKN